MKRFVITFFTIVAVLWGGLAVTARVMEPTPFGPPQAPDPALHPEPLVRIYGANVWGIRGRFAVHTWIATKAANANAYTIYQVIGWHLRRKGTVVSITQGRPDRDWLGSPPILLHEVSGERAGEMIEGIHSAALSYPYSREYVMWPGPNSNSFLQWVVMEVEGLNVDLPAKAIGKNWMISEYAVD